MKASRGIGTGVVLGILLMFGASLAGMLAEPAAHWGDRDPLPNFAAADALIRLMCLVAVIIGSVIVGGLMGGIVAWLTSALAQRGASPRFLRVGLAVIGTGVGALLSRPRIVTAATVGALVFSMIIGMALGDRLASRAIRSAVARSA